MNQNQKVLEKMVLPPAPSSLYYQELASDFVEQVVGRQRWRENLRAMAGEKTLRPALDRWLQTMNIRAKPELVLQGLSDFLKRGSHVWK
jgi:hypothetical protein